MNVFEIQIWLKELSGKNVVADGIYGPKTEATIKAVLEKNGVTKYADAKIAIEQLILRKIGGLAVGLIDGIAGPALAAARTHWARGPWRNAILRPQAADSRMPQALKRWPTYDKLHEFYGEPGTGLTLLNLPFPLRLAWDPTQQVTKVTCHKLVADSLLAVQRNLLEAYGFVQIQKLRIDMFGGCYAARPMRGSTKLSTHAWGIAWDTDPVMNPLAWDRSKAKLAGPEYEKFWKAWTDEGWLSLGKARDFDWMHTQACQL